MSTQNSSETVFQRIIIAFDGSDSSERALRDALKLARDQHATVRAVHVLDESALYRYPTAGIDVDRLLDAWRQDGQKLLEGAVSAAEREGVPLDTELVETGGRRVADVLADAAQRWGADLIVMGTHGRHGVQHLLLGSVAEGVIRRASVPILVVRNS